ncbi:hypothetical protein QTP88_007106 [Uroleucon formosanum]
MSNRDRDRFRSYESGCKKREKKQIKQDFLKTQQGSFLKFLSKENDKEKSPELSPICLKSPKALNKDSELPQTIISNFKESNSVEFQEILSCKLISNESKIILTNTAMNDSNMYDDPANWPISISQDLRTNIVKLGPKRIINFNFPSRLKEMEDDELMKNCKDLHIYLLDGEHKDIDGNELCHELQIFKSLMEINTTALQSLSILKKINVFSVWKENNNKNTRQDYLGRTTVSRARCSKEFILDCALENDGRAATTAARMGITPEGSVCRCATDAADAARL